MIPVIEVSLAEDLAPFTTVLWEYEVPHRVVEEADRQILMVSRSVDPGQVRALYDYWKQGGDLGRIELRTVKRRRFNAPRVSPGRIKATLSLIALSVLATLLIGFGANDQWMARLTFVDFTLTGDGRLYFDSLLSMLESGQWWRLVTPVFLHFSLLHILFNLLWVWVVGQRVEVLQGPWALIGLAAFTGVASNVAQFWVSGPMFGGMSGVVFGLLSYTWLWDRLEPHRRFGLPPALMGLMVLWLALGFTGVLEGFGLGAIANTAHLVGMLAGLAFWPIGRLFKPR
ncbi:MAG: rhomboid family intramembrane serine protease [Oceanospirillaceae bacterium]|nr:rhomboid family intramembrane serine protease [Oceanospirillaceae bacterium]